MRMAGCEKDIRLWPCLEDRNSVTPLDPYYFYQDTWAAKMIFKIRPKHVVDIGSTALLVGILSQFVPVTSIDIRPLPVTLPGLACKRGSITDLPFDDGSIEFVSSMCVIEHIGLGRYGDALDSQGSIKALMEISRVIKIGGHFLFSVPISHMPRVDFNAHRVFSKQQILELLPKFEVKEEKFLFPHPGKEEDLARLNSGQFGIWCALFAHV
jgi:SAM-dependent methyltransferase